MKCVSADAAILWTHVSHVKRRLMKEITNLLSLTIMEPILMGIQPIHRLMVVSWPENQNLFFSDQPDINSPPTGRWRAGFR